MGASKSATMLSSNARVELGTDKSWFCPNVAGRRGSACCRCGAAGRGAGDSRVRGFAVGCLDGGSGGCGTSEDDVVSIDKERRGTKGNAIWRRDACKTVDNMDESAYARRNAFAGRKLASDRSRVVPCSETSVRELPTKQSTLSHSHYCNPPRTS